MYYWLFLLLKFLLLKCLKSDQKPNSDGLSGFIRDILFI